LSRERTDITSHITIEEAKEQGLTQIVKQLETDKALRESLGMRSLQDEIKHPIKAKLGRKSASAGNISLSAARKLIRVNTNKLD
jgi:hypothetical protein